MVISRLRQKVGSCSTNQKLSRPTNSMPSNPETRFHSVKDSATTEARGMKVNSSTPSRLGAMNSQPTRGRGSAGALPAARGRTGSVRGAGARVAGAWVVISVLPEACDERVGIGVDRLDRTGGGALQQPAHVALLLIGLRDLGDRREVGVHVELGIVVEQRSEEHTSELQSRGHLVCRPLLETKNNSPA